MRSRLFTVLAWLGLLLGLVGAAVDAMGACGSDMWAEQYRRETAPTWIGLCAAGILAATVFLVSALYLSAGRDEQLSHERGFRFCSIGCFGVLLFLFGSVMLSRLSLLGR